MEDSAADQSALAQGRAFEWHEVTTADVEGSIAFYTAALDFGFEEMEMGEMGPYKMLTRNGRPVCGVTAGEPGDAPFWAVYLSVDDVDARVALAEEHGATILTPGFDVPTVGRMALIQDPQGARIWLFKSEASG